MVDRSCFLHQIKVGKMEKEKEVVTEEMDVESQASISDCFDEIHLSKKFETDDYILSQNESHVSSEPTDLTKKINDTPVNLSGKIFILFLFFYLNLFILLCYLKFCTFCR